MAWICEDHPQISSSGSTVKVVDGDYFTQCRPLNAYFKPDSGGAEKSGTYYWELVFKSCRKGWLGLTTEEHFGPGYRLKGLLYGGNLSNGSSLLVGSFGEPIQENDVVGILLILTSEDLKMYLFQNGQPLGLAYHIQKPFPTPLFPCVHLYGPGEVTISKPAVHPVKLQREPVVRTTIEGLWKFKECDVNEKINAESREWNFTLSISLEGSRRFGCSSPTLDKKVYRFQFQIVNSIWGSLEKTEDGWSCLGICSTRIGVHGKSVEAEGFVSGFIGQLKDLQLDSEELTLVGRDGPKVRFQRAEEAVPGPVTENIFMSK